MSRFDELADSGDIVSTKSLLALDEDLVCYRCSHIFTLAEGNYEGKHPKYENITGHGIMCPKCKRVNIAYWKTPELYALEKDIDSASTQKQLDKRVAKYQRKFLAVQNKYGNVKEG